jgi:hypothetical protein
MVVGKAGCSILENIFFFNEILENILTGMTWYFGVIGCYVVGAMPSAQRFLFCWKWTYNASVNIVDY